MGENTMTSLEFTELQREFYKLSTIHLKLYEQDSNFLCGWQNQTVNPTDWLIAQAWNLPLHLQGATSAVWEKVANTLCFQKALAEPVF